MKGNVIKKAALWGLVSVCLAVQTGPVYAETTDAGAAGIWKFEQNVWRHYDTAGKMVTGWIETASGRYYLDPQEGTMKTGWFLTEDGSWIYLNTEPGETFGKMLTGWHWIDGHCYYFESSQGSDIGKLYMGKITPDGYHTNSQGQWAEPDGTVHFVEGKGLLTEKSLKNGGSVNLGNSSDDSSGRSSGKSFDRPEKDKGIDLSNSEGTPKTIPETTPDNGEIPKQNENTVNKDILLNVQKTKLVNLGWVQYAVISFGRGTLEDYRVYVDGTDITDVCTRVDDDGSIVKWQTTVINPKVIKAVRISDQAEQTVEIGKGTAEKSPEKGSPDTVPYYVLTNGPVSRFDYYLDVYDKDGNVRREPERTTFSINGEREENTTEVPSKYYVPDVIMNLNSGKGEILVKLSLETEEQERWFSQVNRIKALNMDSNIINGNLPFGSEVETEYGKTGVIRIPLPQDNLRTRGRYQINIGSAYSQNKLTLPIHLVDSNKFTMQLNGLNTNPRPGEDFAFDIVGPAGMTFGTDLVQPIYQVDLTTPSGEVITLENLKGWYEIGPYLRIFGTDSEENIITGESGVYTVTVYAYGYQTMSKKVEVAGTTLARNSSAAAESYGDSLTVMGLDAITSATLSPGDGSSGGEGSSGGGGNVNGYLLFDHDLLSNALILNEIGLLNKEATAVCERWFSQTPEAVMREDGEVFYKFNHYMNAYKDERLEYGRYLSFEDYTRNYQGGITQDRPGEVKRVLEDGLLGTVFSFSEVVGKEVPELEGTQVQLGENFLLTCSQDPLYISKIREVYLDGSGTALRSDDYIKEYEINAEKDGITIYHNAFNSQHMPLVGKHTLLILADGYRAARVTLTVSKSLEEFELSLSPNPERRENDAADVYYTGQDIYIKAAGDRDEDDGAYGDFLKNILKVSLTDPDGTTKSILSEAEGKSSREAYYSVKDDKIILKKGLFQTAGEYNVIITAPNYAPKTLAIQVEKAAGDPVPPTGEKKTPSVKNVTLKAPSFFSKEYYEISFSGLKPMEIGAYLDSEEKQIFVNGMEYDEKYDLGMSAEFAYVVTNDSVYGGPHTYLHLTSDGFTEESNSVVIEVPGYETLEFTVKTRLKTVKQEMLPPAVKEQKPADKTLAGEENGLKEELTEDTKEIPNESSGQDPLNSDGLTKGETATDKNTEAQGNAEVETGNEEDEAEKTEVETEKAEDEAETEEVEAEKAEDKAETAEVEAEKAEVEAEKAEVEAEKAEDEAEAAEIEAEKAEDEAETAAVEAEIQEDMGGKEKTL